jgi:hypothetical protein
MIKQPPTLSWSSVSESSHHHKLLSPLMSCPDSSLSLSLSLISSHVLLLLLLVGYLEYFGRYLPTYLLTPSFFSCYTLHTLLTPAIVNSLWLLCFLLGTKSLLHDLFSSVSVQWFFFFPFWGGDNFCCFFLSNNWIFPLV